ncbi:uncharacterized protein LOC124166986 [Ischnura elegans]|uniref:uncharacterized protein LOC124166986 n=1 Tax=Ischnura elegans TaxID=197161 RepID=UPI001ED8A70F|nr:uncharacterized protein LOC124166986 [Ischnura elegans]
MRQGGRKAILLGYCVCCCHLVATIVASVLGSQDRGGEPWPNAVAGGLDLAGKGDQGGVKAKEAPFRSSPTGEPSGRPRHRHHHDDDGSGRHRHRSQHQHHHHDSSKRPNAGQGRWGPYFEDPENATSVSVPLGGSVHLNCRVGMLHDKTVIWLRRREDGVSLLTVGDATYSSDSRVSLRYQYPNNWRLHISPVEKPDEGTYLCQLSTHPPRAIYTNVTVLAPELKVVDEHGHAVNDRYYKTGSTIELTCRVTNILTPSHVVWTKDDGPLPAKVTTTGISDVTAGETQSQLIVPRATTLDSGVYTCAISVFSFVEVQVHVLNGEKQAAVQHDSWGGSSGFVEPPPPWLNLLCTILTNGYLRKLYHSLL